MQISTFFLGKILGNQTFFNTNECCLVGNMKYLKHTQNISKGKKYNAADPTQVPERMNGFPLLLLSFEDAVV